MNAFLQNKYMMQAFRLFVLAALIATVFARPQKVSACSCVMPGTPANAFVDYDAVFTGRVLGVIDRGASLLNMLVPFLHRLNISPSFIYETFYGRIVTFAVHDSWKGVSTTTIDVETGYGDGDCGYEFVLGNEYLVYGYGTPGDLGAGTCSRTAHISDAGADLAYLNTLPSITLTPSLPITPALLIILFAVIPVVVAGIFLFRYVRQKRSQGQPDLGETKPG